MKTSIKIGGIFVCLFTLFATSLIALSFKTDKEAAVLITKSNLLMKDQGEVLDPVFNNVVFGYDETRKKQGILSLDAPLNPSALFFSTTRTSGGSHELSLSTFIDKIRASFGEEKIPSGFEFLKTSSTVDVTNFTSDRTLDLFLMDKEQKEFKVLPEGTQSSTENKVEKTTQENSKKSTLKFPDGSLLIQFGSRAKITELEKTYRETKGLAIYRLHFASIPTQIEIFESKFGVPQNLEKEVNAKKNLDLRYHKEAKIGGLIETNAQNTASKIIPVCKVATERRDGKMVSTFYMNAESFIEDLVRPNVPNKPKLRCLKTDEGLEYMTACKSAYELEKSTKEKLPAGCGNYVIHGTLDTSKSIATAKLPIEDSDSSSSTSNETLSEQLKAGAVTILLELESEDPTLQYRVVLKSALASDK